MQITDSYRELNRKLHESRPDYGTSGQRYAPVVLQLCKQFGTNDVLDYGAGKRTLESSLGFLISNYDPCIKGLDSEPNPAQIVACTDVLEHVEPDCIDEVLRHIRSLTLRCAFLSIATRPAKKFLEDGRNAHLIQEDAKWWIRRLWDAGFRLRQFVDGDLELQIIVEPERGNNPKD